MRVLLTRCCNYGFGHVARLGFPAATMAMPQKPQRLIAAARQRRAAMDCAGPCADFDGFLPGFAHIGKITSPKLLALMSAPVQTLDIDDIIDNFDSLDDWDDRYRYLIELGRMVQPLDEAARTDANKVRGCASQVWLDTHVAPGRNPVLSFRGESDAHIVRGLVALTLARFSGLKASDILDTDAAALFQRLGLSDHLTPQRSNGVRAMVERIKSDARKALA